MDECTEIVAEAATDEPASPSTLPALRGARISESLTARFEGSRDEPWTFAMAEPQRGAMLRAIVAFEMPVARLDVKLKLSQNRPAGDRRRVIAALAAEPIADAHATADLMRRRAAPPDTRT